MIITGVEVLTLPDRNDSMMLVVVDTDEGIHGIGEVGIRSRQWAARGAIEHFLPLLVGQDPFRIEHLWQVLHRRGFFPSSGVTSAAIAAIDVALWDIKGKALGVPVYQLFGGRVRDRVPAYIHVGDSLPLDDFVGRCRGLVADGWRHLRWAVPTQGDRLDQRITMRQAIERFHAARDALGDDVELILDVHTRLDLPEAVTLCREIEAARPYFVEDPLRAERSDAYLELRARTGVPLATGESLSTKWEFAPLIEGGLIDHVRIDVAVASGLTEARKIAAMAEARYIKVATHNPLGPVTAAASLHLNLATPNVGVQEFQAPIGAEAAAVFTLAPAIDHGWAEATEHPGLGVDIDREAARAASAEPNERPELRASDGSFTNW